MPSSEDLSDYDSDDGLVENEGVIFSPAVRTPPDTPRVVPDSMARRGMPVSAAAISVATADQNIQEQQPLHWSPVRLPGSFWG
jgi:hypothetical protein